MEAFKAELMKEVRKEFQKIKQEIVEGKIDCYNLSSMYFVCVYLQSVDQKHVLLSTDKLGKKIDYNYFHVCF